MVCALPADGCAGGAGCAERGAVGAHQPGALELLTAREVAALIKTNARTVYRLMKAGEMQAVRFGRLVRVAKPDLERFICEHRKEMR